MSLWSGYVKAAKDLGFNKATIVHQKTFRTLGCTSNADIPTAYKVNNESINENQELLDSWGDKKIFYFYGKQYKIISKDDNTGNNCGYILCKNDKNNILIAKQFKTIWFVVSDTNKTFKNEQKAYEMISKKLFAGLEEMGYI